MVFVYDIIIQLFCQTLLNNKLSIITFVELVSTLLAN